MSPGEWEAAVSELWSDAVLEPEDRIERMRALADQAPHPALGAFELGGVFDSGGREADADVQYAAAADLGLAGIDRARAAQLAIQHASTLRNLGRVDEALRMLRDAPAHESVGAAHAVFLALTLHSAGRKDEALRVSIEAIEPTRPRCNRSMRNYRSESRGSADRRGRTVEPRDHRSLRVSSAARPRVMPGRGDVGKADTRHGLARSRE
ncbi:MULTISPECIES: tetratricopeptide repeat protein [Arthrobacter]|uniref:Tetratricopeptide repeat protein n=2 Tax=Arthrobacter TaxID=1663 RepID=A0ABU9KKH0_9MICC|nr:tetratricopeptide repeat protein [Arthrobacter sp. YJM1]MDP5227291.1 tetratricopeptide repeat protein [Arthrobacter sp. YJM1]